MRVVLVQLAFEGGTSTSRGMPVEMVVKVGHTTESNRAGAQGPRLLQRGSRLQSLLHERDVGNCYCEAKKWKRLKNEVTARSQLQGRSLTSTPLEDERP